MSMQLAARIKTVEQLIAELRARLDSLEEKLATPEKPRKTLSLKHGN